MEVTHRHHPANPLRTSQHQLDDHFGMELYSCRMFVMADWSRLFEVTGFQREMVDEMMALTRKYEALGYQWEPVTNPIEDAFFDPTLGIPYEARTSPA